MNLIRLLIVVAGAVTQIPALAAEPVPTEPANGCFEPSCVVARRGTAAVTVADIMAKAGTLEPRQRHAALSDPRNLNQMIEGLLIKRQIANELKEAEYTNDPVVQARLAQVRDEVLSVHKLDLLRDAKVKGDFERLAREHYQANKASFQNPREVRVRHLLVSNLRRSDAEALELVNQYAKELATADDDAFTAAVMEHSDDSGKTGNGGIYTIPENSSEYDEAFKNGALALTIKGQLSQPVKSAFGYHLIRLLDQRAAEPIPFEKVRETIIEKVTQDARRAVVMEYRAELSTAELEFHPENLQQLMYGDMPAAAAEAPAKDTPAAE